MKKITAVILGLTLILGVCDAWAKERKTEVIAHRGYWKSEGSAQNSLSALRAAMQIACYGSEFDVLLTADSVLVVVHGPKLNGLEVEKTPYSRLRASKLANGESLPTLEEYLKLGAQSRSTKLVLEIKTLSSPERQTYAVDRILSLVKTLKLERRVEYIAFDKHATQEVIRLNPKAKIAYLNGDLSPQELLTMGCRGLDYHYSVLQQHPHWIQQAHDLGLTVNVWTVDERSVMQEMIAAGVDFITTNEPVVLQEVLGRHAFGSKKNDSK